MTLRARRSGTAGLPGRGSSLLMLVMLATAQPRRHEGDHRARVGRVAGMEVHPLAPRPAGEPAHRIARACPPAHGPRFAFGPGVSSVSRPRRELEMETFSSPESRGKIRNLRTLVCRTGSM